MFYGWINIIILFFIYFNTLGLVFYGFSVIFPAMIDTLEWGRAEASFAHSINTLLTGFLAPFVALVIGRFGSRKTLILGLSILVAGLCLLGTMTNKLWHWTLLWGLFIPFGFAFSGLLPIQTTINFWFNIRRATVLGIVLSGAALGGFIAQPIFTWLIQHFKLWELGWLTAGGCSLLALILACLVKDKPDGIKQYPDGLRIGNRAEGLNMRKAKTYRSSEDWDIKEALKTRTAWFLMVFISTLTMAVFLVAAHGVLHLTDLEYSKIQAASTLSFIFLSSGIARFSMGWLGDLIEPRWIATMAMLSLLFSFVGIWKAPNLTVLMLSGPLFGFSYGTAYVMFSVSVANYFGANTFPKIFGFMIPWMTVSCALVPLGAGYIVDKLGNYNLAFIILCLLIAAGIICSAFSTPPTKEKVRHPATS